MTKKPFLIIAIILISFSFCLTFLTYFGIIRYWTIKNTSSCDKYVEKYKKIEKMVPSTMAVYYNPKENDEKKLIQTLNSIFDSTVKVSFFNLIMSTHDTKEIPLFAQKWTNLVPNTTDYGDEIGNTIVPMLNKEKDCETLILVLTNNIIYGKDFINQLTKKANENPDKVIIDSKKYALAFRPKHYGCEWLENKKIKYNLDYFLKNAKNGYLTLKYRENYKI